MTDLHPRGFIGCDAQITVGSRPSPSCRFSLRSLIRKFRMYAHAGLPRYWIIDLDETGPEIVTYELRDGVFVETGRHAGDDEITLDVGPLAVAFAPNDLLV